MTVPLRKKLMILGAGPSQLPLIKKAVELGLYVITVDNVPGNIGHSVSHQSVDCSTTDQCGVLNAAKELAVDGVLTFASDVATPTVGYVVENMGWPGGRMATAAIMSNKAKFRAFQKQNGLSCPNFVVERDFAAMRGKLDQLAAPVVIKPVDSSGSRGITKLENVHTDQCLAAFKNALQFSRCGLVCAEEFIAGTDVSGDGFLANGKLSAVITQKYTKMLVPRGHRLPTSLSPAEQQRVLAAVAEHCRLLGYTDGPLDFDALVTSERVIILEMSPRLGGNGIPRLIQYASGIDLMEIAIRFALREEFTLPAVINPNRGCGVLVLGSNCAGKLQKYPSPEAIMAMVPDMLECQLFCRIGARVAKFSHSADSLGIAFFNCHSDAAYQATAARIQEAFAETVECATA